MFNSNNLYQFLLKGYNNIFLNLTAIYLIFNLYSLIRILKFFKRRSSKLFLIFIYVLLTAAFPITEILSHTSHNPDLKYLMLPGYYSLPFLLYVFLMVIIRDILLVLNYFLKVIPPAIVKSKMLHAISISFILLIPLILVFIGSINYNSIHVNEFTISIPAKLSKVENIKVLLAADFHLRDITSKRFAENFVNRVNSLNADMLLMPGDILEGDNSDLDTAVFEQLFRKIKTKYGVYASTGNHESHGGYRSIEFFNKASISILQDEYLIIADSFYLVGRKDIRFTNRKTIKKILKNEHKTLPVLVLDHRPLSSEYSNNEKIDVQFSGHTHNGQLFPVNFITEYLNTLSWGYKKIGNTHLFVTSGIQGWGPPVRTAGEAEIMLININFIHDKENI
jgi:uncharacterized protein